jgi:hypothetical protein
MDALSSYFPPSTPVLGAWYTTSAGSVVVLSGVVVGLCGRERTVHRGHGKPAGRIWQILGGTCV